MQIQAHCHGMVTNWGTHMYDVAQWGIGCDSEGGPIEVVAKGEFPDRGLYDVHTRFNAEAFYANGLILRSRTLEAAETPEASVRFVGETGWIKVSRNEFSASNPEILREKPHGGVELRTSNNHMGNFLESLRAGTDPVAPVEVGHRSNTVCLLHHLSMKLGRKIKWDPHKEEILDDPHASALLHYEYRSGYKLPT